MIIASGSKAAGVSKNIGRATLHEQERCGRKKQRERDAPQKNRSSRQKTEGAGTQYHHGRSSLFSVRPKCAEASRDITEIPLVIQRNHVEVYFTYIKWYGFPRAQTSPLLP